MTPKNKTPPRVVMARATRAKRIFKRCILQGFFEDTPIRRGFKGGMQKSLVGRGKACLESLLELRQRDEVGSLFFPTPKFDSLFRRS
jgi:hypothetical protein